MYQYVYMFCFKDDYDERWEPVFVQREYTVASKCSRDAPELCAEHGEMCVLVGFHV